jgi:exopolysaccharide biosynthesis polyprenyl glycosylphosphotransferase
MGTALPADLILAVPGAAGFTVPGHTVAPAGATTTERRKARSRTARLLPFLVPIADVVFTTLALAVLFAASGGHNRAFLLLPAAVPLLLLISKLAGFSRSDELWFSRSTVDELPRLVQVAGVLTLALLTIEALDTPISIGPLHTLLMWAAALIALTFSRVVSRSVARQVLPAERCIVIAEGGDSVRISERLEASNSRFEIVAAVELTASDMLKITNTSTLHHLISRYRADRLIIAPSTHECAGDLIRVAKASGASVSLLPGVFDLAGRGIDVADVNGIRLVNVRRFEMSRLAWTLKRGFDIVAAAVIVLLASPLLICIALAIKLDSDGPVFFKQVRVGRDGRYFGILKYRSMVANADAQKDALRASSEGGDGLFKLREDPRVTRVGRFLRRSSLDELPQIFNVLRGDMSIVGPRPLIIEEDEQIFGLDRSRLSLLPGITGPWQVLRTRASRQEMVEIDYRYVANWSLWLDVKILVSTISHVARRGNL